MEPETRLDFLEVVLKASGTLDHFLDRKWSSPSPPPSPVAPLASLPAVSTEQLSTIDVEAYVNTMDWEEMRSTFTASIEAMLAENPALASVEVPCSAPPMPAFIPAQETPSIAHQLSSKRPVTCAVSQPIHVPTNMFSFHICNNSQTLYTRTPSTTRGSVSMAPSNVSSRKRKRDSVNSYVKKPLNAFMLYRAEQRLKIQHHLKITNSSVVSQEAGKCWKSLSAEEQAPYFERARKIRLEHEAMLPDWSVRDNYHKKDKKMKITNVSAEPTYGPVTRMCPYSPVPAHPAPSYQPQTVHAASCYGPVPLQILHF